MSAEDCLFADLGLDPAVVGCAQYEATDLLIYGRRPDPSAALIVSTSSSGTREMRSPTVFRTSQ